MSALEKAIDLLCSADSTLTLEFTGAAESGLFSEQSSFLTIALNIIGATHQAAVIFDQHGDLIHSALFCPATGLVLDASGIRPAAALHQCWQGKVQGSCTQTIMGVSELQTLCPPESIFFARVLAALDKVAASAIADTKRPALVSAPAHAPGISGYQVQNDRDEHWLDRPSFQILSQETAMKELLAARASGHGRWLMVVILEGDIEEPVFA